VNNWNTLCIDRKENDEDWKSILYHELKNNDLYDEEEGGLIFSLVDDSLNQDPMNINVPNSPELSNDNKSGESKEGKTQKKRKHKKHNFLWCHQCKQKHDTVYYCSKYESGSCSKKYCKGCIERHYNESVVDIDPKKWICMYCRNICICAFCRRKRGEESPKKQYPITKKRRSSPMDEDNIPKKKLCITKLIALKWLLDIILIIKILYRI